MAGPELRYHEKVRPPIWLLAFIYFLFLSLAISVWAALGDLSGALCLVILTVLLLVIARSVRMTIEVTDKELIIGRAHIELQYLGDIEELSAEQMRLIRGRDADPAAFLAIRFWQDKGVKIQINDDRDPTPYWLVSTRASKEFKRTLCTLR